VWGEPRSADELLAYFRIPSLKNFERTQVRSGRTESEVECPPNMYHYRNILNKDKTAMQGVSVLGDQMTG